MDAAEPERPATYRFAGDVDAVLREQVLDIAVAQREAEVEPHRVLDDLGWEAVTGIGKGAHDATYPAMILTATGLT